VAADLLNDRVLPFFEEHEIPLLRVLTDRGAEYCGQREHHEYELYLAVENIDHSRTKARHPQTNGICGRFHRTIPEEFCATAFRKKLYTKTRLGPVGDPYTVSPSGSGRCSFQNNPATIYTIASSKQLGAN